MWGERLQPPPLPCKDGSLIPPPIHIHYCTSLPPSQSLQRLPPPLLCLLQVSPEAGGEQKAEEALALSLGLGRVFQAKRGDCRVRAESGLPGSSLAVWLLEGFFPFLSFPTRKQEAPTGSDRLWAVRGNTGLLRREERSSHVAFSLPGPGSGQSSPQALEQVLRYLGSQISPLLPPSVGNC